MFVSIYAAVSHAANIDVFRLEKGSSNHLESANKVNVSSLGICLHVQAAKLIDSFRA